MAGSGNNIVFFGGGFGGGGEGRANTKSHKFLRKIVDHCGPGFLQRRCYS